MTRRRSAILAIALSMGLVLGAWGDDATPSANDDDTGQGAEGGGGFTVTLTADGIEMPDEVTGGVVEVTLESDLEHAEVNFTQVAAGTTEDQLKGALSAALGGGPLPEFILATTGVVQAEGLESSSIILPEGQYIAWALPEPPEGEGEGEGAGDDGGPATTSATEGAPGGEEGEGGGGPPPEAFATATFTATPGEAGDLPDTGGNTITARDYTFDIDISAGAEEFTFRNDGPDQFHHAIIFDFGDLDPSVVEENLPAFLESEEDAPPPPAFSDLDPENVESGFTTVLSPGLAAIASGEFESGSTYAAVCFIADKSGGPPHAFAHGMRTVFTVE